MKHTFHASKDLYPLNQTVTAQSKPLVRKGEVLATIESPVGLDQVIGALQNGTAIDEVELKRRNDEAVKQADEAVKAAQANAQVARSAAKPVA